MDAAEATQGIRLLQRLIECNKLTKYQAKILAGQSEQPLRFGSLGCLREIEITGMERLVRRDKR